MSVFFVHDVNHGIVKPLDRKFRVREISPVDELAKTQATHAKDSNTADTELRHQIQQGTRQQQKEEQPKPNSQQAIQAYQENAPASSKLDLGKVKDIMSDPVISIFRDQTLAAAWTLMQEHGINHVVILNDEFEYCGLLSEKSFTPYLMKLAQAGSLKAAPDNITLDHFCQKDLLSTHPETQLHDLGVVMLEYGLDAIAVSDHNKIIGVVTKSDILKVLLKHQTFEERA